MITEPFDSIYEGTIIVGDDIDLVCLGLESNAHLIPLVVAETVDDTVISNWSHVWDSSPTLEDFRTWVLRRGEGSYAIRIGGQWAGMRAISISFDPVKDIEVITTGSWVHKKYRGRGYGTMVLNEIIATLEEHDELPTRTMQTSTQASNVAARRMLERCGFKVDTTYNHGGYEMISYLRELENNG